MNRLIFTIRTILIAIPIIILLVLFNRHFGITGKIVVEKYFPVNNNIISKIYPGTRIKNGIDYSATISEPAYMDVKIPSKAFDKISLEIEYKNEGNLRTELGVRVGAQDTQINLIPLDNLILDKIEENNEWQRIKENNLILWQKKGVKQFEQITDFLNAIPALDTVSAYNVQASYVSKVPNYYPSKKMHIYTIALRGHHELYTYIDNEDLNFTFTFQDINRHNNADPVSVSVIASNGKKVWSKNLADDGYALSTDPVGDERVMFIEIPNLDKGVYKLVLNMNDDTFLKKIITYQSKLVFKNRIYLAGNKEYRDLGSLAMQPTELITNAKRFSVYTAHGAGLQKMKVDKQVIPIDMVHKKFIVSANTDDLHSLYSPFNDLQIQGRGFFAFDKESFFYPTPQPIETVAYENSQIDYILTSYKKPQKAGDRLVSNYKFDLDKLFINDKHSVQFVFSSDTISPATPLRIYRIKATLYRSKQGVRKMLSSIKNSLWK